MNQRTEGRAQIVQPCDNLDEALEFFVERLGFRIVTVFPADDPRVAVVSGHGLDVRLERGIDLAPGLLRLLRTEALEVGAELVAPNGTRIEIVGTTANLHVPALVPALVISRAADDAQWKTGRAGMRYRDLLPDRLGGHLIASHIRIPNGGSVPDYVHYHDVAFQMIYCVKGWVRVVYEGQGPAFVMQAGDCVLQPPRIRHRVLECSPGLEVVELGAPAEHETHADQELELPSAHTRSERDFGGQRFLRHEAASALWQLRDDGLRYRDVGMSVATGDLARVRVVRAPSGGSSMPTIDDVACTFLFIFTGELAFAIDFGDGERELRLGEGDSVALPGGTRRALTRCPRDTEWLEVLLPRPISTP